MEVHAVTVDTSLRCVACCRLSGELFARCPFPGPRGPWCMVHGAWCMAVGRWSLALHTAADEVLSRRTWQATSQYVLRGWNWGKREEPGLLASQTAAAGLRATLEFIYRQFAVLPTASEHTCTATLYTPLIMKSTYWRYSSFCE